MSSPTLSSPSVWFDCSGDESGSDDFLSLPPPSESRFRPLFDYSDFKLGPDDIRLLRPIPTDGQLKFELLAVARSQAPSYTAISYTWGDGLATKEILLNDARFAIRWNLWSCLGNLSIEAARPDVPWDYIWVDAICINQANNSERRFQVLSMDQIYRGASCVSVWLGPPSECATPAPSSHYAFQGRDSPSDLDRESLVKVHALSRSPVDDEETNRGVATLSKKRSHNLRNGPLRRPTPAQDEESNIVVTSLKGHSATTPNVPPSLSTSTDASPREVNIIEKAPKGNDWTRIIKILTSHRYWTRFWVIQEFSLGSKVEICLNEQRIDWAEFKDHLYEYQSTHKIEEVAALPLLTARHPDQDTPHLQPLLHLLVHYRRSSCSNPLDRVFALLGLLPRDERTALEKFFPDYSLSHNEVVIMTLKHLMLFHPGGVTLDSEEVFVALGVTSKPDMKSLYESAKGLLRSSKEAIPQPQGI